VIEHLLPTIEDAPAFEETGASRLWRKLLDYAFASTAEETLEAGNQSHFLSNPRASLAGACLPHLALSRYNLRCALRH
jgi:hypothetical protein